MDFTVRVNGESTAVSATSGMPLLWVLRDILGLTGTKYGCGTGMCGSCTVHLDGQAVRSCITPVDAVGTREVTTIEGLAGEALHPVQQAWIDQSVVQCGYCQAGQIMAAVALLDATDGSPTDDLVRETMAGILCRCGTYQRIRAAIEQASGAMP